MPLVDPGVLACVFAHPDDEAFGPGGAIAYFSQKCPVHLICVTDGDADGNGTLGETRRQELRNSASILGVASVEFLGYSDGTLNNAQYHTLAVRLQESLDAKKPDTILTFDINGVSGHLDHIAVAMICSYLFEKLEYLKTLMYFCEGEYFKKILNEYFVFVPPGYSERDIDFTLDVSEVYDRKINAMRQHVSQKNDCDWILDHLGNHHKAELFRIWRK